MTEPQYYIGIDQGVNTAVAVLNKHGKLVRYSQFNVKELADGSPLRGVALRNLLRAVTGYLTAHMPSAVIAQEETMAFAGALLSSTARYWGVNIYSALETFCQEAVQDERLLGYATITPKTARSKVLGKGGAGKKQIIDYVNTKYKLELLQKQNHTADAIIIAEANYILNQPRMAELLANN